tara:strand:- start:605 stop:1120 length:516 start_codon:yes stop_codon:yes gene_type:complete
MASMTETEQIEQVLKWSKVSADEEALAKALEDIAIQDSKQDISIQDILAMIQVVESTSEASQGGGAEGGGGSYGQDELLAFSHQEDIMPPISYYGDLVIFRCPHCDRALSVAKKETNCRKFVCVGKSDGSFANPHASRDKCMTLLRRGWFGCGEAFTLPADGSPPKKRAHG